MRISMTGEMYLFKRMKLLGPGVHWGVLLPNGLVAEYTVDGNLRFCSIDEFSSGKDIEIERVIPRNSWSEVYRRLQTLQLEPRKYDLFQWNCETFARWLVGEEPRSEQIRNLVGLAGIAFAFKFLLS